MDVWTELKRRTLPTAQACSLALRQLPHFATAAWAGVWGMRVDSSTYCQRTNPHSTFMISHGEVESPRRRARDGMRECHHPFLEPLFHLPALNAWLPYAGAQTLRQCGASERAVAA